MKTSLEYFWKKKLILSFVAIVFIVIIHNSATAIYPITEDGITNITFFIRNLFAYGIGSIAVPLFFLLSGFAIFRNYTLKSYPKKLKSRIKTLLIPYLIWNFIGLLIIILATYTPLSNIVSSRELFTPSFQNFFEGIFLYKYNFQFWFLYDLIVYTLLTPLIYLLIHNKYIGIFSCILIFCLPLFSGSFINLNLSFTIFYFLGCFFGRHYLSLFAKATPHHRSIIAGISFVVLLTIKMLSVYNIVQLPTLLSQVILILLLISTWFFSDIFIKRIKEKAYFKEFFPVYALHTYFLAIFIKIIYYLLPKTPVFMLFNEISSLILTVGFTTLFALIWHKKLPKLYNIMFGSRANNN